MAYAERKRLLFFGLPWTFTKYTIEDDMIRIKAGLFRTVEDDCYMYKVQDVKLKRSLLERIFRLGTVECHTGDVTHPILLLVHIKRSGDIKNYILQQSEETRRNRRTFNTLDIGASQMSGELDFDNID